MRLLFVVFLLVSGCLGEGVGVNVTSTTAQAGGLGGSVEHAVSGLGDSAAGSREAVDEPSQLRDGQRRDLSERL